MKHTVKRILTVVLVLTMAIGVMPFTPLTVNAEGAATANNVDCVKFMVGEYVVDSYGTSESGCEVTAPAAIDPVCAENMFGWYGVVTNGNTTEAMLIKVGQTVAFEQGDVAVFQPLTLDISQVGDPTLRVMSNGKIGMRFLSRVSKAGYGALLDEIKNGDLKNAKISFGTLIADHNDVMKMDGGLLTHAALSNPAYDVEDVPFKLVLNAKGKDVWYQQDDTFGYITGTLSDIAAEQNATPFIAVGYAKLTFGGESYYAYASNADKKGASIYELAIEALNDVASARDADHKIQIDKTLYSAYSVSDREVLCAFVDNVIALETAEDDTVKLIGYDHYNPNSEWKVLTQTDAIWDTLVDQLDDLDMDVLCIIAPKGGAVASDVGICLDGITPKYEEIEHQGVTYYLIGLSEHTPNQ